MSQHVYISLHNEIHAKDISRVPSDKITFKAISIFESMTELTSTA
jgi:hypothetical protein